MAGLAALGVGAGVAGVLVDGDDVPRRAPTPLGSTPAPSPATLPTSGPLPTVAPLAAPPDRTAFAAEEQRCAAYLVALAAIADDVDDSTSVRRGFIDGGWWRTPSEPYNARTCELVHTMSWFAASNRPWNPYFRDAALLSRLDAALGHYLGLQHSGGAWPEYDPSESSPAATAFAIGYLTKTLVNLRHIDALGHRHGQIVAATRWGMRWFLDPDNADVWQPDVVELSNQVLAAFSGAVQALREDPEPDLAVMLDERLTFAVPRIQSPAGFLYDPRGMDVGYNFSVSLAEIAELHHTVGAAPLLDVVRRLADWLGYVMVPEPDGAGLIVLDSPAARTTLTYIGTEGTDGDPRDIGSRLATEVASLRPFYTPAQVRRAQRTAWRRRSTDVDGVERGAASPRVIANLAVPEALPTASARAAATARLPPVARGRFTELRRDGEQQQDYLFVRRPRYYAAVFHGVRPTARTRTGLGLLWHPQGGAIVQAVGDGIASWGVELPDGSAEGAADTTARYIDDVDGSVLDSVGAVARARRLCVDSSTPDAVVRCRVIFDDEGLTRSVSAPSGAVEQVPLLLRPDDVVTWASGADAGSNLTSSTTTGLRVRRGRLTLDVTWGVASSSTLERTDHAWFRDASRRIWLLRVPFDGATTVRYAFSRS